MDSKQKLVELLRIKTISYDNKEQVQWNEFLRFHDRLKELFPLVHRHLRRTVLAGYSLLYQWKGKSPNLEPMLFASHIDVVPATGEGWTVPPFAGVIRDGFVYGRGALDTKTTMLAILESIERLLEEGFTPERDVLLAFGHDEEVRGEGAISIALHLKKLDVTPAFVLDEGGAVVTGTISGVDVPVALIGVGEKGYLDVEICTKGEGGHSAMPPWNTSLGLLARVITRLERNQIKPVLITPVKEFIKRLSPHMKGLNKLVAGNLWLFKPLFIQIFIRSKQGNALLRTTMAPTMAKGSDKANVLSEKSSVVVNARILPGQSCMEVLDHIKKVLKPLNVKINPLKMNEPSAISSIDTAGYRTLSRSLETIIPGVVPVPYLVLGGTDASRYESICTAVYRFSPYVLDPELLQTIHGEDERISFENIDRCIDFYSDVIKCPLSV